MFLLVNKPKGITSHDVVDKVRKITGEKRVGHAGTLDPNATGLLIVGIGRDSTKLLGKITKNTTKTYRAEIFLGEERDTDDIEGKVVSKAKGFLPPSESEVRLVLLSFLGEKLQIPPAYSAVKIKGKEAYRHAREGKKITLEPRKVMIHSLKLVEYNFPRLVIDTEVSAGTYIRALARDFGEKLGCGAYLMNLNRSTIGKYSVSGTFKLDDLTRSNWKEKAVKI